MLVFVMVLVGIAEYQGITCALVFACLCLCSADVFLVPLPLFVLVLLLCLSFGFRLRPTGIGRAAFCISGVEKFWPTPLYKSRLCT
jgi:hypothetical protein